LREHLDGDGSIITYKDHYNTFKNPEYVYTRLWLVFVSASETHIKWIRNTICRLILLKDHLWKSKPKLSHRVNIELISGKSNMQERIY